MSVDDASGTTGADPCPLEVDVRGDAVVLAFDSGERINLADIDYEAAYRLADEFVSVADQAAVNAGVIGDE